MGNIKENKLLFDEYLKTGNFDLIHKILINNQESIKTYIKSTLVKNQMDENLVDEYFSIVYEGMYKKLIVTTARDAKDKTFFYNYIRREIVKIVKYHIKMDQERNFRVIYTGLQNNCVFSDDFDSDKYIDQLAKSELVYKCLGKLDAPRRKAIELRYGLGGNKPMQIVEIAQEMNISNQRVSQLILTGEEMLRQYIKVKDKNNSIIIKKNTTRI